MHIPDEILAVARESALRFGGVEPMLFVNGTKSKLYTPLPFGKTNAERIDIMFNAGIAVAKSGKVGDVEWAIFVSEAWVSPAREGPAALPSQDPDRMEVLLFNTMEAKTNVQGLEMYSCVRNGDKDIIELKRVPIPGKGEGQVGGQLLPAFLTGFRLFKR